MKKSILEYMEVHKISVKDVARELNIKQEKFYQDNQECWSAEDLLEICHYLKVDPREFWKKKVKIPM